MYKAPGAARRGGAVRAGRRTYRHGQNSLGLSALDLPQACLCALSLSAANSRGHSLHFLSRQHLRCHRRQFQCHRLFPRHRSALKKGIRDLLIRGRLQTHHSIKEGCCFVQQPSSCITVYYGLL